MNLNRQIISVLVLSIAFFSAPLAVRAVSLSELFAGGTITAGNLTFSDWTFVDLEIEGGAVAKLNQIDVFPLNDDPVNHGIGFRTFGGGFATAMVHEGVSVVELWYSFRVVTTGPPIENSTVRVTDFHGSSRPSGRVRVIQDAETLDGFLLSENVAFARARDTEEAPNFTAFEQFAMPQSELFVTTAIAAAGPTTNDFMSLNGYEQRFGWVMPVPEPGIWTLAVTLLMGLATARVRQRKTTHDVTWRRPA